MNHYHYHPQQQEQQPGDFNNNNYNKEKEEGGHDDDEEEDGHDDDEEEDDLDDDEEEDGHDDEEEEDGHNEEGGLDDDEEEDGHNEEGGLDDDGHRFGNFKHYYDFHSDTNRLQSLLIGSFRTVWEQLQQPDSFNILDVGCNEGNVTAELLHQVQEEIPEHVKVTVYGIDFDERLIKTAQKRYKDNNKLQFFVINIMNEYEWKEFETKHFDFIDNISIVSCLRVSMWIHLNTGDSGFQYLLDLLGKLSRRSSLLFDPQKCSYYKKAYNRNEKLGKNPLPYSPEDLQISSNMSQYCMNFYLQKYDLKISLHKDITKWGGTLLFLMTNGNKEEDDDVKDT